MTTSTHPGSPDAPGLSISAVAASTGVSVATLRTWEIRHGYPQPTRLPGGHRRYRDDDVAVIGDIVRRRDAGQSLPAAIAAARADHRHPEPSVFAALRRRHPGLVTRTIWKPTMLALTRAIEDECCARAESPRIYAAFQQPRFYLQSEARWDELARTARAAVVFAAFDTTNADRSSGRGPVRVAIPPRSPLRREWLLVCAASDHPACVVGWEVPGRPGRPDRERRFETIWSVDPEVVEDAAAICQSLAADLAPDAVADESDDAPGPRAVAASADLRRAEGLLTRTLHYLDHRPDPG